jgi:Zn-dependent M16 (insulinase) family peptidase
MSPSEEHETRQVQAEHELLADKVAALDAAQREGLLQQGLTLQEEQMKPTDVSCLPTLSMADLAPHPEPYETSDTTLAKKVPTQICLQPTNSVTHFRALLDTSRIDPKLRSDYLPLFLAVATKMGTAKHDYRQFDRKIQLSTSGLGVCSHITESPETTNLFMDSVLLSSVCLDRNVPKMLELWQELLTLPSFKDKDRLETLVRSTAAELANGIAHSGHRYAMLNSSSRLTLAAQRREQVSGLRFISKIKEFASAGKEQMDEILEKLQQVANILYSSDIRCAMNMTPDGSEIVKYLDSTFSEMNNTGFNSLFVENKSTQSAGTVSSQHHVLPLPVGYLGRSIGTGIHYTHPDHAALRVTAQLLTAKYLHPEVRERGGAYGSGATMNPSGTFSLFSYRDPEASRNTGPVFDKAAAWLLNGSNYNHEHIEESKLSVFQRVDTPTAPGDRGMTKFLLTVDRETLQKHRLALKNVKKDDVLRVTAKYLDTSANPLPVANTLIGPASTDLDNSWEVVTD